MVKKNKLLLLLIFTILIIISTSIAGVYFIRDLQGINLTVTFSDARGLYEKSPVEYKGIQIGSVQKIQASRQSNVSALLKIDSNEAEHIRQNALFVISQNVSTGKPPGILMGYCKNHDPNIFPEMTSGTFFKGEDSEVIFTVKTRVGCFSETANNLSKTLETFKNNIDSVLNSPKVHQLYQDLEIFILDLNKITQDHIKHFIEEKGPEIRQKIEDLIKELEQMGRKKEAEEWEELLNILAFSPPDTQILRQSSNSTRF
jgi:ABC-type transporter Mla subunit MlaD